MVANHGSVELKKADLAVLAAIKAGLARDGYAPTVRELATRLGYRWPQSVQRRIDRLVEAGMLQRAAGQRTLVPVASRHLVSEVRWTRALARVDEPVDREVRLPIPVPDLVKQDEDCVIAVLERSVRGGPVAGDLLYCALGRRKRVDDLLAYRDMRGTVIAEKAIDRRRVRELDGEVIGVVVAWLHRST
jgi:repressor LexA